MSFELKLTLSCDNGCGAEEDYSAYNYDAPYNDMKLPVGWEEDYDNGDSIFKYICEKCVQEFREERY